MEKRKTAPINESFVPVKVRSGRLVQGVGEPPLPNIDYTNTY